METSTSIIKARRIESIDLLRGAVMIIMALDHVRDYFHADAFVYSPTDLSRTSVFLFFTRLITHYCAPVFVFLAGVSAHLYGAKRSRKELSLFLLTRGIWLALAECFIITLEQSFNPLHHHFNLQVIWAIGICMIVLSGLIWMDRRLILLTGLLLIGAHNLLDTVHVPGTGMPSFLWALLHEPGSFHFGRWTLLVNYPVIPWMGIMATGYCLGRLYVPGYDPEKRKYALLSLGSAAIVLFAILRSGNFYGDAAHWSVQKNAVFSFLSFLNVTKYPPSLLYTLMTLGPALVFLSFAEKPLNSLAAKITVYGRVPMFYYLAHMFLIHLLAVFAAVISGYGWSAMILNTRVNAAPQLKGYGFNLLTVYIVWVSVILILYPFCRRYDRYKKANQATKWWLSYL
jgi:uncharacterized membrane protein